MKSIPYANSPLDAYRGGHYDKEVDKKIKNYIMKDVIHIATIKEKVSLPVGAVVNVGFLGETAAHSTKESIPTSKS